MDHGNRWATIIKLNMVYILYFGDFLWQGSRESLQQNIMFRLTPTRTGIRTRRTATRSPEELPGQTWLVSPFEEIRTYLGIKMKIWGWCGRNCVTEWQRHSEMLRMH